MEAPVVSSFEMEFGPEADNAGTRTNHNEDGVLRLDVHSLWPRKSELIVGIAPEDHGGNKTLAYRVKGDGSVLEEGRIGAWILGKAEIDAPVAGLRRLEIEVEIVRQRDQKKSAFLGDPAVVTDDGRTIFLSELDSTRLSLENVDAGFGIGVDYYGGPVKICGTHYDRAIPVNPEDASRPARIVVDLTGLGAMRFKSMLGGDYPFGNEHWRRRTMSIRTHGRCARFATIVEPYEDSPMIAGARAVGPDWLVVSLKDGRTQEIEVSGLDGDGSAISVNLRESKDGTVVECESTD